MSTQFNKEPKESQESKEVRAASSAAEVKLLEAVRENNLAKVKEIVEANKANKDFSLNIIPAGSYEGNTPLLQALSFEFMDIAHYLLDCGASPWITNSFDITALPMLSMVHKNLTPLKESQVLSFLNKLKSEKNRAGFLEALNKGVPLEDPRTPLAMAIECLPIRLLEPYATILLKEGGKYEGRGPLWSALLTNSKPEEILNFLTETFPGQFSFEQLKKPSQYFANQNALMAAVGEGNLDMTRFFFEQDPKRWSEFLNTKNGILHHALDNVQKGDIKERSEIIHFLIRNGADTSMVQMKQTILERIKELPSKPWATDQIKEFAQNFKLDSPSSSRSGP